DESGHSITMAYDPADNLVGLTDEFGRTTTYSYNSRDQLISETDVGGATTQYAYDALGRTTAVTDPLGQTTHNTYDAVSQLIAETDPLGHVTQYGSDAVGNLTSVRDRNGRLRTFGYDARDDMVSETWWQGAAEARVFNYAYDANGEMVSASDPDSHYTMTYDALGRMKQVDNLGTPHLPHVVLDYTYDAASNLTRVQDSSGVRVDSTYDSRDLLTQRSWSGGGIDPVHVTMAYNAREGLLQVDRYDDRTGTPQLVGRSQMTYAPTH